MDFRSCLCRRDLRARCPSPVSTLRGRPTVNSSSSRRVLTYILAKPDGSDFHKLLSVQGALDGATFSPDGTRIRFTLTDLINTTSALWEVGANGTGLRPLLPGWNNPPQECCGKWTRDGTYYIFQSNNASGSNIWAMPERDSSFPPEQSSASSTDYRTDQLRRR